MGDAPAVDRRYLNLIMDSARWEAFTPRQGDVIVCTSYKAGTTWTQMICTLLSHGSPDLPAPLGVLGPWLDMRLEPIDAVLGALEAQTNRRVIKTHTALDGAPYYPEATYVYCGRDPRDIFMSMQNHLANGDPERFVELLGENGIELSGPPPELPDDLNERFRLWATTPTFPWEADGLPYWSHFHHGETFWRWRRLPNIHFLHYADLTADLEGEMRRLAGLLGIEIAEEIWPALVQAASFEGMKANADRTAPNSHNGLWKNNSQFFNKGANAQWRGALSDESLALYEQVMKPRYDAVFTDWMERGSKAAGDPRSL